MLCKSLPEVMAYQNDKLVRLYCKRKNICQKQSLFLFNELKKITMVFGSIRCKVLIIGIDESADGLQFFNALLRH